MATIDTSFKIEIPNFEEIEHDIKNHGNHDIDAIVKSFDYGCCGGGCCGGGCCGGGCFS